jgi:anti-sigma factor RsiW
VSDCDLRLGAYLDGELGPQERRAVEGHLAGCELCRAEAESLGREGESLRRVLGGLLLHVGLPSQIVSALPQKRALAGFGVALAFAVFSFVRTGPASVMNFLTDPQRAVLFLDWALMLAAGSLMIWPEKAAWVEGRVLALARGERREAGKREQVLIQGLGLVFLCVTTVVHYLVMHRLGF